MPRDEILLRPHDARWAPCFVRESAILREAFADIGLGVDHIGSTSIPGIVAKPILDMLGSCPDVTVLDGLTERLKGLGYESKGEYGLPGRRYCVRYDASRTMDFLHLHVFSSGDPELARHLFFRDYLRAHPEASAEYDSLKTGLQSRFRRERGKYLDGKAEFIRSILAKSLSR